MMSIDNHSCFRLEHLSRTDTKMIVGCARRRGTLALGAFASAAAAGYAIDQQNGQIVARSSRVMWTGGKVVVDFRQHLKPLERGSVEYKEELKAFNLRTAQSLLHLCFHNGGIYTKFGQQLATFNHALPREFTDTLAQLQDRAKAVPFAQAVKTIEEDLQRPWQELFQSIHETPIAAASLAQVHDAVDRAGRRVAVKVQYPHLASQTVADLVVIKWAYQLTEYFFPDIQLSWIMPEFENAMNAELDFDNEKRNSRRIKALMRHNSAVHVPEVYDDLSSKRVLVMEYIEAPKISDVERIEAMQLDTKQVAKTLCEVFGEMVFCHGFVHCDPHAGNIFVRPNPDPHAKAKAQLVLLDHGLYRELDEDFRETYCDLWRGMILRDPVLVQSCAERLNAGRFGEYLPLLFTYRGVKSNVQLASSLTEAERVKLTEDLKGLQFSDVTDFLKELPRDMLFVFRTNNMIRSLNKELGGSARDRFAIMGTFAVEGHALSHSPSASSGLSARLQYWADHLNLVFRLSVMDWLLGIFQRLRGEDLKTHRSG